MAVLGPLVTEAAKWVGAAIKRQFYYLCCFTTIITTLKEEAEKLEDATQDLQGKVETAKNDVRVITRMVDTWLMKSEQIKDETDGLLKEVPTVGSGSLKFVARFSLSKRATKMSDRLKELRGECTFDVDAISQPGPSAATKAIPLETTYEFVSRKQIEEDIMEILVGGDKNMIGICGMGGLGKTIMAKRIMNEALKKKVFHEIVFVVISQIVDKLKIQLELGGPLGLKLEGETSQVRAQKLSDRLSGTKKILLVLDDVWKKLVLEELGIPCNHKGCTILLTSRNRDALSAMNVQEIFGMEVLSKEDAWFLFRRRVGSCVDEMKLNSVANNVVKKCNGLPLALTTVGVALKDEKDVRVWKDALRQLRMHKKNIPEFIESVYHPLKLSYDVLCPEHKTVFLLCSLYAEDAHIPLNQLAYFCMGLCIPEGEITNVEDARNWMCSVTKILKSRSLLLDSEWGGDYVRMHDVVRDVCIFIAKQLGYIGGNDCTWISSSQISELRNRSEFPKLRLLFSNSANEEEFKLDSSFFEGIKDLYVFYLVNLSLKSLPQTTQSLKNLNTLVLDSCKKLETLSVVGELVNLQILVCRHCNSIKELPLKMKGLNELKLLDLTGCTKLQRIGRGIISSLVGLEELKMLDSFKEWEGEDREERENAGLRELEVLTKLRCLEIEIQDRALAAEDMHFSSKVDSFDIRFSSFNTWEIYQFTLFRSSKKMNLCLNKERRLGHWIEMQLLRDTECLHLHGNGVNIAEIQNIRWLELHECDSVKEIETKWFPSIEHLGLYNLPKLEKIWHDQISLPLLKVLKIEDCTMMEQVFLWEGESRNSHHITKIFSNLEEVHLNNLPNVTSFYQGIEGIEFPQLRTLNIQRCGKMKSTVWKWMGSNENNLGDNSNKKATHKPQEGLKDEEKGMSGDQIPLLFPKLQHIYLYDLRELVSFCEWNCEDELPSLTSVRIQDCPNMKQLWKSSSLRQNGQTKDYLPQLEFLSIEDCEMLEQVFLWNGEDGNENYTSESLNSHHITKVIPKVKEVKLCNLPNLTSFYQGIEAIEFPQLREMKIEKCRKMKRMVSKGMGGNENNWGGTRSNADIRHLSCQPQKEVSFGCLKDLTTDWNSFGGITHVVSVFGGLESLRIHGGEGGSTSITSSIATSLVNLKHLFIGGCDEMVQVIKDEEEKLGMNGSQRTLLLPKLEELHLENLPKLVRFCECDVEWPSLREVKIIKCPNMKTLTLGSLTAPNMKYFDTDIFNHLQVPFNGVKELAIRENELPLNCYEINESQFNRLEKLEISGYKGSVGLFLTSITGTLVNLRHLSILVCEEMVRVIEEGEEKKKVVSGSGQSTLQIFPKLEFLRLFFLPKLESFCQWKCDVGLPSLREVDIYECGSMKYFTLGRLVIPNLKIVRIDHEDVRGVEDLNGVVQQRYEKNKKEMEDEEEEEENGDDQQAQERKGEIEEEKN